MSKTILFGGSGFFGPAILEKNQEIISVGRTKPPLNLKNKHINLNNLEDFSVLDNVDFDKVIFLIGSSNHHEINLKATMGVDFNVYPMVKILSYLKKRNIKKFICFTTILLYDQKKMILPVDESQLTNPYINDYVFSKYLSEQIVKLHEKTYPINNCKTKQYLRIYKIKKTRFSSYYNARYIFKRKNFNLERFTKTRFYIYRRCS